MASIHVDQSLPICCALAICGGVFEVAATAITAIPSARQAAGLPVHYWWHHNLVTLLGNLLLQGIGTLLSHLVAPWFGPVSLVVPFFYSATLLSNMLIFGLLGETFTKNMRVGTHVIVIAAILLPLLGPTIQEDQLELKTLLWNHWYAQLWSALLLLGCAITGSLIVFGNICHYPTSLRIAILLLARASALSINLTVSRAFVLGPPTQHFLMGLAVLKVWSGAVYTYAIVVQSHAVEQARFVPLNATWAIVVNALTGILVREDWKVVQSWYGYICVFVLLALGCDLLLSVPSLLNSEHPDFGTHKRASLLLSSRHQ